MSRAKKTRVPPSFEGSFASHEKAKYWSDKNTKSARETFLHSHDDAWFKCEKNHDFEKRVDHVSEGRWCPYCQKAPKKPRVPSTFEGSFASHPKAKYWSSKNTKSARDTFLQSNDYAWFKCDVCPHEFKATVSKVSKGQWCPYCTTNGKLCDSPECGFCFERSFASHPRAAYWNDSEKNEKTARQTRLHSRDDAWFKCDVCHREFKTRVYSISSGTWCPKCQNKTEALVFDFLCLHFENPVHQFKTGWCKNPETNKYLPFDICVSKTIIEVDGAQHYEQVSNWKPPEETQTNDRYKEECALKNGYSVIRILQKDVWYNKIDWKKLLLEHIKEYETPVVICLWKEENSSSPIECV